MKTLISARMAAYALLTIMGLTVLFHLLVLLGVVPFDIVWGGRIQSREQLMVFEAVSISLNLLMLAVVAARVGWLGRGVSPRLLRGALWGMAVLFALNTVGNVFSNNTFEKLTFTPLTSLLALLCLRLALEKEPAASPNAAAQLP